jgi:hypothetical protein
LGILYFADNKINLWEPFKISSMIIAIFTLIIYFIVLVLPESVIFIENNNIFKTIFMFAERKKFLNWWIPSVFHMSSPLLIITSAYYLYKYFMSNKYKYLFIFYFFTFTLIATGTRANILAIILVFYLITLYYFLFIKKYISLSIFLFFIGIIFFLAFIYLLFTNKNSSSIAKDGHLASYLEFFKNNTRIFLFGQGPGSFFYTKGFNSYTTNTEFSYLELIRMFGIFFTTIIMGIYIYPLIILFAKKTFFAFSIGISYLAYLFIAGTNPLLIGPTGFMALAMAYYFKTRMLSKNVVKPIKIATINME